MTENTRTFKQVFICTVCARPMKIYVVQQLPNMNLYGVEPCECKGIPPVVDPNAPKNAKLYFLDDYRKPKNV